MYELDDTIFASATGGVRAALTVVRISGRRCGAILEVLCHPRPAPRRASLRTLRDREGEPIDRGLVLWFPAPGSYTGEDSAELHVHGGRAVWEAVATTLTAAGARPADPGEFTRRAFLHGKMDLPRAEAVADLVAAETQAQRWQALREIDGELGTRYRGWSRRLLEISAGHEACVDFPDEDLPPDLGARFEGEIAAIATEVRCHLHADRGSERLRDGLVFAIVGPPNVGKSSLLNVLAGREAAIVAPSPGTTRDVLEVRVSCAGVPVTLLDTAGLRDSDDPVETEGVRRALERASAADVTIGVVDASGTGRAPPCHVLVANKVDLAPAPPEADCAVSVRTGVGVDGLRARIDELASALTERAGPATSMRARHRAALTEVAACLERALDLAMPELAAEELRIALGHLGRITGAVGAEEILDSVFSQFCIGK